MKHKNKVWTSKGYARIGSKSYKKRSRIILGYYNQSHWKSGTISQGESKLRRVCKFLFPHLEILYNDRKILNGLELDIFIPSIKLGIEFNGSQHYVFSKEFHRNKDRFDDQLKRDKIKKHLCKLKGIKFIEIPCTIKSEKEISQSIKSFLRDISNRVNLDSSPKADGLTH